MNGKRLMGISRFFNEGIYVMIKETFSFKVLNTKKSTESQTI